MLACVGFNLEERRTLGDFMSLGEFLVEGTTLWLFVGFADFGRGSAPRAASLFLSIWSGVSWRKTSGARGVMTSPAFLSAGRFDVLLRVTLVFPCAVVESRWSEGEGEVVRGTLRLGFKSTSSSSSLFLFPGRLDVLLRVTLVLSCVAVGPGCGSGEGALLRGTLRLGPKSASSSSSPSRLLLAGVFPVLLRVVGAMPLK
jgi:hypothetical protein